MIVFLAVLIILNNTLFVSGHVLKSDDEVDPDFNKGFNGKQHVKLESSVGARNISSGSPKQLDWQRLKRSIQITETIGQYASNKEQQYGINQPVVVHNQKNSVYQYTFKNINTAQGLIKLPYVVRASIRPEDIQPPKSRSNAVFNESKINCERMGMNKNRREGNNDELGHLISYKNGGPPDFYNIVPQTKRINRGTKERNTAIVSPSIWRATEDEMTQYIVKTKGRVEMTVVVYYDGAETRPAAFGVAETHYDAAGNLVLQLPDYFYSNDPTVDPDILNKKP